MKIKKFIWFLLFVLGMGIIYFFTPLKSLLSQENINNLKQWIQGQGVWAPFIFILLYIFSAVVLIPGSILTVLGGLIFGVTKGTIFVLIGANLGAIAAFFIAHSLGRDVVRRLIYKRVEKLEHKVRSNGFYVVFWLRLIPIFPFNILNYALGLTSVRFKDYVLATILGIIPGSFVYVSLGHAASRISLTDPHVWTRMDVWGPFLLVILLSLIPKIFKKRHQELHKISDEKHDS